MDKELLFKPRTEEADVEIPGVGTFRVRGLTRHEVLSAQGRAKGAEQIERVMLAMGVVDPKLTEDEVARWQRVAPAGEMEPVTSMIQQLSGMAEGAGKSDVPGDGDGPGD